MSVRLVTTPWFTKNLAGGELDTRRLLGGRREEPGRTGDGPHDARRTSGRADGRRRPVGGRPAAYHRAPCCSPSTSATRTSPRPRSGPGALARDAPRGDRTRGRPPTSSSSCSTGCCASTTIALADVDAIVAARRVVPGADRRARAVAERRERPLAGRQRRAPSRSRSASTGRPRSGPTGWSTRSPPRGCTARRPSSSTSARRRRFDCVAADGAYVGGAIAPGARARPRGARGADRQAAADRAAGAGPGDRPRHRHADAVRRRSSATRRSSAGLLGADPARARRRGRRRTRRCVTRDPDRRPVRRAVGPGARRHRRDRPRPDAQGPRASSTPRSAAANRSELGPAVSEARRPPRAAA